MKIIDICTILLSDSDTERQTISWDVESRALISDHADAPLDAPECVSYEEATDVCWDMWGNSSAWDLEWIDQDDEHEVKAIRSPMTRDEIIDAIETAKAFGPSDVHGDASLMDGVANFWEPGYDFTDPDLWGNRENLDREFIIAAVRYDLWKKKLDRGFRK